MTNRMSKKNRVAKLALQVLVTGIAVERTPLYHKLGSNYTCGGKPEFTEDHDEFRGGSTKKGGRITYRRN